MSVLCTDNSSDELDMTVAATEMMASGGRARGVLLREKSTGLPSLAEGRVKQPVVSDLFSVSNWRVQAGAVWSVLRMGGRCACVDAIVGRRK